MASGLQEAKVSGGIFAGTDEVVAAAVAGASGLGYVAKKRKAPDGVIAARIARRVRRAARTKTRKRTVWQKVVGIYATAIRSQLTTAIGKGNPVNSATKVMINREAMKQAIIAAKNKYKPVKEARPKAVTIKGLTMDQLVEREEVRVKSLTN